MAKDESKSMGVFGAVNVGDEACWWDYGQLRLYRTNNSLLTGVSRLNFCCFTHAQELSLAARVLLASTVPGLSCVFPKVVLRAMPLFV